ncbi:MAG TPA: type II secretion system protein GspM [Rhodanobacteraceae bacterium]|nr:type II secretion system protein GspM [Rhodanobacteraceae bacterium]
MRRPKPPSDGRPLALGLLLVVLVLAYFLFVHWWFVAPQIAISAQMADLRDQQQHFAAVAAQRDAIDKRIAAVRSYQQANQAFLPQTDPSAAAAALIQRVTDVLKKHAPDGTGCTAQQSTPLGRASSDEPYQKVSVRIRLSCDMEPLLGVLYDLEEGKPYFFVEDLMIYRQASFYRRAHASSKLQVQFTLSGYLRQPGAKS